MDMTNFISDTKNRSRHSRLRNTALFVSLISMGVLVGCGHKNPLAKMDKEEVGKALVTASMKATRLQTNKDQGGTYEYRHCIENKESKLNCETLYSDMASLLAKEKGFGSINVSDLKDKTVFAKVKPYYDGVAFNTLDF